MFVEAQLIFMLWACCLAALCSGGKVTILKFAVQIPLQFSVRCPNYQEDKTVQRTTVQWNTRSISVAISRPMVVLSPSAVSINQA